jgi:two-component system NarL family sensor kinase
VRGDETAIQQVIRNLCSNAAKYSPAGGRIEVRVESLGSQVAVRVLDEGAGIRMEEVEHLFDPFYRSPATAAMAGGAGIGLYVCHRLVEAMGGEIWGRRRPDVGSEFGVALPHYELSGEDDLAAWELDDAAPPEVDDTAPPASADAETIAAG